MFNLNNANMENLITQINKERLVNSDTALMMKELYYYVPCEYWYDKQDRLRTDIEGRNTPMYMCECPTLAACIQHSDFIDLLRKATKVAAIDTISQTIKDVN